MSSYLQQQIQTRMEHRGLTVHALEREAGLKISAVRNILQGSSKKPSATLLKSLSNVFGCTIEDLIDPNKTSIVKVTLPSTGGRTWSEPLYINVVKLVSKSLADKKLDLKFEQVIPLITEAYKYSIAKSSDKADQDFVNWLIGKDS